MSNSVGGRFLMLVGGLLLAASVVGQTAVAYYPLDGNANDESSFSNDGSVTNAISAEDRFGNPTGALEFNSSNGAYVTIPHADQISLDRQYTISIWFYNEEQDDDGFFTIAEKTNPEFGGHSRYGMWVHQGGIVEICVEEDPCASLCQRCADSKTKLEENRWYHLVGTYDGRTLSVYIDGELDSEMRFSTETGISQTNFEIFLGTDLYGDGNYLNGRLDEFELYSVALDANQVSNLYENQVTSSRRIEDSDELLIAPTLVLNGPVKLTSEEGGIVSYKIIASSGKTVGQASIQVSETLSIPTQQLSTGLYFIIVELSDGRLIRKRFSKI